MKKNLSIFAAILALCAGTALAHCGKCPGDKKAEPAKTEMKGAKAHDCGDCPMHKKQGAKKCGGVTCPEKMKGAETVSKNIENGVEVIITGKDAETAAMIQELAVVHYSPKAEKCHGCPTTVPGAETKMENIQNGVKVTITGKTPEAVKAIQAASAAEHKSQAAGLKKDGKKEVKAARKYMCEMKCVESAKPGKCPKCGMPMQEIK